MQQRTTTLGTQTGRTVASAIKITIYLKQYVYGSYLNSTYDQFVKLYVMSLSKVFSALLNSDKKTRLLHQSYRRVMKFKCIVFNARFLLRVFYAIYTFMLMLNGDLNK